MTPAERMRAYRQRRQAAGYKMVRKRLPQGVESSVVCSDHRVLDAISLALHCKIAGKINQNMGFLETPKRNLEHWRETAADPLPAYLVEGVLKGVEPIIEGFPIEMVSGHCCPT